MKSGFMALALGIFAAPLAAQTEFQGGGFLSNFSEACAGTGWNGVVQVTVRLRPAEYPGNGDQNRLSIFLNNYAVNYRFPDIDLNVWTPVTEATSIGGSFTSQTGNPSPSIRQVAAPGNTAFTDDELHIIGEIRTFDWTQGCNAHLNAFLHRR